MYCMKKKSCLCLSCSQIKDYDDNLMRKSVFLVGDCKNQTNELFERAIRENIFTLYRINDNYRQSNECIDFILNYYKHDLHRQSQAFLLLYSLIILKYESLKKKTFFYANL